MVRVKRQKQYIQRGLSLSEPTRRGDPAGGVRLTGEEIERYLDLCRREGYSENTVQGYRRKLQRLYDDLPEDKTIGHGTLESWRGRLLELGYAPSTVNGFLSVSNTYLDFIGHREYQATGQMETEGESQPELTREEYLRLLQTARTLGQEKVYLLVKLFATTPLPVQQLHRVTVEAVREGKAFFSANRVEGEVRFPKCLKEELLGYAGREGRLSGPIFVTREGTPISRTYVTTILRQLCPAARVPEEKGNPRCLRRLYQSTLATIEANVAQLVEQAMERQLEREQMSVGWEE